MKKSTNQIDRFTKIMLTAIIFLCVFTGCSKEAAVADSSKTAANEPAKSEEAAVEESFVMTGSIDLEYANNFTIDYYTGGYKLISIVGGGRFLTIPEGAEIPEGLESDMIPIYMPLENISVSSTPVMSLINAMGGLDRVTLTTMDIGSWYIDNVIDKMDKGEIIYIGDYKNPDYEIIAEYRPSLYIVSAMVNSTPEVTAMLEELAVPMLMDQSNFEDHPLGRTEWIKLYGALLGLEEQAEAVFDAQAKKVDSLADLEATGKTAAIFYITSNGSLYARNSGDYMVKMLELAGGEYIFNDLNPGETGTQSMEMEQFYARAKEADYILYIYSVGGNPNTLGDFLSYNPLLADFKAVKEGHVWCTTPDFFQLCHALGDMVGDINEMLTETDSSADKLTYLFRLK